MRNHVLLYDGRRPSMYPRGYRGPDAWTLVRAPADATLTFDGRYVLDWSSRLRSTDGGPDLVLDQGPTDSGLGFWAIDSDGSVLVAARRTRTALHRLRLRGADTGACDGARPAGPRSGDPEFLGVDM